MNFFEETAQAKQPFAAVDSPPVLSFADMAESMDAAVEESVKRFAKDIYEHWKVRRLATENLSLEPMLKVSLTRTNMRQIIVYTDLFFRSLKPVKTQMIAIPSSVSAVVKCAKFARLVVAMRKARRSFNVFVKSWKRLDSWSHWCASARSLVKRCSPWSARSSCSATRSRR
jgi:hypothetical protein